MAKNQFLKIICVIFHTYSICFSWRLSVVKIPIMPSQTNNFRKDNYSLQIIYTVCFSLSLIFIWPPPPTHPPLMLNTNANSMTTSDNTIQTAKLNPPKKTPLIMPAGLLPSANRQLTNACYAHTTSPACSARCRYSCLRLRRETPPCQVWKMLKPSWRNREAHMCLVTLLGEEKKYESPHIWELYTHYKWFMKSGRSPHSFWWIELEWTEIDFFEIALAPSGSFFTIQINQKLSSGPLQTTGIPILERLQL